jgi:hypothetical protein
MQRILLQLVLAVLMTTSGFAADWVVDRVRGSAELKAGGAWVQLARGQVVADKQTVRTGVDGHLGLARGKETIELAPGTQVLLHEGEGKMTSLEQSSGVVTVDVERRNVQHFSVQTPFLAAVVKGTRFVVAVTSKAASVVVDRGTVQVQDSARDLVVDVVRGQSAEVGRDAPLLVSGAGPVAVFTFEGTRVVNGTADVPADERGQPAEHSETTGPVPNGSPETMSAPLNQADEASVSEGTKDRPNKPVVSEAPSESDDTDHGNGNGNGGGNGNGNSGNGNGHGGGNGNGNSGNGNGNGGGNGNGNSGNGNGHGRGDD